MPTERRNAEAPLKYYRINYLFYATLHLLDYTGYTVLSLGHGPVQRSLIIRMFSVEIKEDAKEIHIVELRKCL